MCQVGNVNLCKLRTICYTGMCAKYFIFWKKGIIFVGFENTSLLIIIQLSFSQRQTRPSLLTEYVTVHCCVVATGNAELASPGKETKLYIL